MRNFYLAMFNIISASSIFHHGSQRLMVNRRWQKWVKHFATASWSPGERSSGTGDVRICNARHELLAWSAPTILKGRWTERAFTRLDSSLSGGRRHSSRYLHIRCTRRNKLVQMIQSLTIWTWMDRRRDTCMVLIQIVPHNESRTHSSMTGVVASPW